MPEEIKYFQNIKVTLYAVRGYFKFHFDECAQEMDLALVAKS